MAVEAAEQVDAAIGALPDDETAIVLHENPRILHRSHHRRAHLDEIERRQVVDGEGWPE
jgi:hypothetical protein